MSTQPGTRLEEIITGDWRSDDVLQELHQERGWSASDIARRFEADTEAVLDELKARDLYAGGPTHPPKQGLARELWEMGTDPDAGGDSR
jgi:hypothetical protein